MCFDSAQALWASIFLFRIVIVIDAYLMSIFSNFFPIFSKIDNNLFMIFLGHTIMSVVASGWLCTVMVCNQFVHSEQRAKSVCTMTGLLRKGETGRGKGQTIEKVLGGKRWQEPPTLSRFDSQRGKKKKQPPVKLNFNHLSKLSWNLKIGHNHRYSTIGGGSFILFYFLLKVFNSVGRGYYCTL